MPRCCCIHQVIKFTVNNFSDIVEGFDDERVYISDMKKVLQWYNILADHNLLSFTEEVATEEKPAEIFSRKRQSVQIYAV